MPGQINSKVKKKKLTRELLKVPPKIFLCVLYEILNLRTQIIIIFFLTLESF